MRLKILRWEKKTPSNHTKDIGLRIKEIRENLGYKGVECAKMLDISPSQLSDWETGQTSFSADQLYKIADVLKVDPGWLLVGERNVMDESLSRDDDLIFYTELKHKMDLGLAQYQVEAMRGNMSPQLFGEIIMAAMQAITDVRKERGLRDTFAG